MLVHYTRIKDSEDNKHKTLNWMVIMTYDEIMAQFDQLDKEIEQFLGDEETIEEDEPLHDLGERLNTLCKSVLQLPIDEMKPARERLIEFQKSLIQVSKLIEEVQNLQNNKDAEDAEPVFEVDKN